MPTLAFLFTDIEGSTRLWERQKEAMAQDLARHDVLLRAEVERAGGHVFKTVGDAVHAVLPTALAALDAPASAQRALALEPWRLPGGLRVRMAVHVGAAEARGEDFFG